MTIDISLIIPTYREPQEQLKQNIGYMKEQTAFKEKRMEIIISDFYEYDDTTTVWPSQDEYFKVVHVDRRGIAYGRHTGIMASKGKAIVNFDADGFFVPNEAVDMLTKPILEGRVHLSCCDNVFDMRDLTPEQVQSISFIMNVLDGLNKMQQNPLLGSFLEPGMSFSREAYNYVGGFSDVRQYEGAILGQKIIHNYTPAMKLHVPVKAVLSPRRALGAMQYGILNSFSNYAQQNFR